MATIQDFWWWLSDFAAKRCWKAQWEKKIIRNVNKFSDENLTLKREIIYLKEVHEIELMQKDEEIERLSQVVYEMDKEAKL